MKTAPAITVISVTYNSSDVIASALASIDPSFPVIVVDNNSTDDSCAVIQQTCPRAKLILSAKNVGFGRANNMGLEHVTTPFALLLNPDAILQEDCTAQLLAAAELYPDAAIIAPVIFNEDGSQQTNYKNSLFKRETRLMDGLPDGDLCAEYLSGAIMLLRMSAMKKIGFFDSQIFLFHEDDDLCMRALKKGYSNVVAHQAKAMHLSGRSSPATLKSIYHKNRHMQISRLYIEKKYYGEPASHKLARQQTLLFSLKMIGYAILGRKQKMTKCLGRIVGVIDFLLGVPAK